MIKQLLTTNPNKRINAHDALKHEWMSRDDLCDKQMNLDMLKAFQANRKFRAAANAVSFLCSYVCFFYLILMHIFFLL